MGPLIALLLALAASPALAREATVFRNSLHSILNGEVSLDSLPPGPMVGAPAALRHVRDSAHTDLVGGRVTVKHDVTAHPYVLTADRDPNVLALVCLGSAVYLQVRSEPAALARLAAASAAGSQPILVIPRGWGCTTDSGEIDGRGAMVPAPEDAAADAAPAQPALHDLHPDGTALYRRALSWRAVSDSSLALLPALAGLSGAALARGPWVALATEYATAFDVFSDFNVNYVRDMGENEEGVTNFLNQPSPATAQALGEAGAARLLTALEEAEAVLGGIRDALPSHPHAFTAHAHSLARVLNLLGAREPGAQAFLAHRRQLCSWWNLICKAAEVVQAVVSVVQTIVSGSMTRTWSANAANWNSDRTLCKDQKITDCSSAIKKKWSVLDDGEGTDLVWCQDCWTYMGASFEFSANWGSLPLSFSMIGRGSLEFAMDIQTLQPKGTYSKSSPLVYLTGDKPIWLGDVRLDFVGIPINAMTMTGALTLQVTMAASWKGEIVGPALWFQKSYSLGYIFDSTNGLRQVQTFNDVFEHRSPSIKITAVSARLSADLGIQIGFSLFDMMPFSIIPSVYLQFHTGWTSEWASLESDTAKALAIQATPNILLYTRNAANIATCLSANKVWVGLMGSIWVRMLIGKATVFGYEINAGGRLPYTTPEFRLLEFQILTGCIDLFPAPGRRALANTSFSDDPYALSPDEASLPDISDDPFVTACVANHEPCDSPSQCCSSAPFCDIGVCSVSSLASLDKGSSCKAAWQVSGWLPCAGSSSSACGLGTKKRKVMCNCASGAPAESVGEECDPTTAPYTSALCTLPCTGSAVEAPSLAAAAATAAGATLVSSVLTPFSLTPTADTVSTFSTTVTLGGSTPSAGLFVLLTPAGGTSLRCCPCPTRRLAVPRPAAPAAAPVCWALPATLPWPPGPRWRR